MSAMNPPQFEMYYDSSANRSPTSQRQATLRRQQSRNHFDAHAYLPSGLYTAEDYAASRFDANKFAGDGRNSTIGGYGNTYDMGGQSWNGGTFGNHNNNTLNGLGAPGLRKPASRGARAGLPSAWMDQPNHMQMNHMNGFMGPPGMNGMMRDDMMSSEPDDELIPTAIVIKNIPFAIKKEQLVDIMTNQGLPLPYAFNYHFDNGVFRGLAFANFTNPDETAAVIQAMNHFELNGRKLRVEYKKMLPAAERERIEREKRERRGQLEEQHRPMGPPATLQTQPSSSSLTSSRMLANSPSPVSGRNMSLQPGPGFAPAPADQQLIASEMDLNDPQTLEYYNKLLLFKHDPTRDRYPFPATLAPPERRIVHTVAHHLGLAHMSKGESHQRAVHVYKEPGGRRVSPPMSQASNLRYDERRALNRSATTDFSDVRAGENFYNGPRHQASGYLGAYNEPPAGSLGPNSNLRAAKSFADLRSYTPSPVPSTASFPTALRNNVASLQDLGREGQQANPPTLMTPTPGLHERGENQIINGLGSMNLGGGFGGSPNRLRGLPSWDRETPAPAPIGSNRSVSTNFENGSQSRGAGGPERQPRGPLPERGAGFPRNRQNGHMARNSDELSQQSSAAEITTD